MQPFILDPSIVKEHFKENYSLTEWKAGNFDYDVKIYSEELSQDQKDTLCEWLATSCRKNFVIYEKTNRLLAGGTSNNLDSWKRKHQGGAYSQFDVRSTLTIRLSKEDITLFRMVWITD